MEAPHNDATIDTRTTFCEPSDALFPSNLAGIG